MMRSDMLKYFPASEGMEMLLLQNMTENMTEDQLTSFSASYNAKRKSPMTVLILDLLLGGIGAHRFYLGQMGMGVLYLFTVGLLGVGALVDLFRTKKLALEANTKIAQELMLHLSYSTMPSQGARPASPTPAQTASMPLSEPQPQVQSQQQIQPQPQIQSQQQLHVPEPRTFSIFGIAGPYAGMQIPVPPEGVVFGRDSASCSVPLQSNSASRRHARLYYSANRDALVLEDLNSTNGSLIQANGIWTKISAPTTLTMLRRFRLGGEDNEFEIR